MILKSDANGMLCFWNDKLSWLVMAISLNTTNQVVPATILQTYHHADEPTIWLKIRINNIHHILIIGCTSMYLLFYCILMLHAIYAIYHVTMPYIHIFDSLHILILHIIISSFNCIINNCKRNLWYLNTWLINKICKIITPLWIWSTWKTYTKYIKQCII